MIRILSALLLFLCIASSPSYADRDLDSILGVYLIPEVESHTCRSLEEKSEGSIDKTSCQLRMKYVNEICLEIMNSNFSNTVPDKNVTIVETEFMAYRILNLADKEYEFGIGREAQKMRELQQQ